MKVFENSSIGLRTRAVSTEVWANNFQKGGNNFVKKGDNFCCPTNFIPVLDNVKSNVDYGLLSNMKCFYDLINLWVFKVDVPKRENKQYYTLKTHSNWLPL